MVHFWHVEANLGGQFLHEEGQSGKGNMRGGGGQVDQEVGVIQGLKLDFWGLWDECQRGGESRRRRERLGYLVDLSILFAGYKIPMFI